MRPTATITLPHVAKEDTLIPGTDIKILAGAELWCLICSAGEQGDVFPQAETWLPERFLPGGPNANFGVTIGINPKPGDVVPFSMGGRRCVA